MKILPIIGKFLISLGVGVLLFVGWTLWGTGLETRRAQNDLAETYANDPIFADAPDDPGTVGSPPKNFEPAAGKPVFVLKIPALDLRNGKGYYVVEGVGVEDLKKGPGHYPECRRGFEAPLCTEIPEVWPGEEGRVIISGHRTTYDHPFFDIDKLKPGDEIITETKWGIFTYEVTKLEVVSPLSTEIANPAAVDFPQLVLTTCNPKYSAAERLIVFSKLRESTPV